MTTKKIDVLEKRIGVKIKDLQRFCVEREITRLELFGSVLRIDFDEKSDIDIMVTFSANAQITLFKLGRYQREFSELLGRPVDLVMRGAIEQTSNPYRRDEILQTAETIYAA